MSDILELILGYIEGTVLGQWIIKVAGWIGDFLSGLIEWGTGILNALGIPTPPQLLGEMFFNTPAPTSTYNSSTTTSSFNFGGVNINNGMDLQAFDQHILDLVSGALS
jgi:hypothetical protein